MDWIRPFAAPPTDAQPSFRGSRVIDVVSDFTLGSIRTAVDPTMYFVDPISTHILFAKLQGQRRARPTAVALADVWRSAISGNLRTRSYE